VESFDVIIVGGGPAGSSCAGRLVAAGARVAVLDREHFPRTKLCAGWITPDVLAALNLDPADYPHRFNSFDHLVFHVKGLTFRPRTVQHSIRRYEFDAHLLKASGARVLNHQVRQVRRVNGHFDIDGAFRSEFVVGAGGTRCPVYKSLFRASAPRSSALQVVAYEQEFAWPWRDPRCHLWFFDHGLPGYAWYVPKADGWLNCGIGALADRLKLRGEDIQQHWKHLVERLAAEKLVTGFDFDPRGYSYYLRPRRAEVRIGNALLAGDAAGLATVDLGEGIGPAVHSGQLAAAAITGGGEYSLDSIHATSLDQVVHGRLFGPLARAAVRWRFPDYSRSGIRGESD
jgi:flavin-dependent dehydrogenase